MNIFYLETTPIGCAQSMYDTHVVKMLLEYAQLLSTSHHILDGECAIDNIYKSTHKNHPCAIWARESTGNYEWLSNLLIETCGEYTHRYGKVHLTERKGIVETLMTLPANIPVGEFTDPPQCMPDEHKRDTSLDGYRNLYVTEKLYLKAYKGREEPAWLNVV